MIVSNQHRIDRLKKLFYLGAAVWAVSSLLFFLVRMDLPGFISAGFLFVWFLAWQFVDFQYINFEISDEKLTLRYYSIVRFGRKNYQSIEFPIRSFYDYRLEKSVFGCVNDLILVTRAPRGIAEYPPVSMAALNKEERRQIEHQLSEHLISKPDQPPAGRTT